MFRLTKDQSETMRSSHSNHTRHCLNTKKKHHKTTSSVFVPPPATHEIQEHKQRPTCAVLYNNDGLNSFSVAIFLLCCIFINYDNLLLSLLSLSFSLFSTLEPTVLFVVDRNYHMDLNKRKNLDCGLGFHVITLSLPSFSDCLSTMIY